MAIGLNSNSAGIVGKSATELALGTKSVLSKGISKVGVGGLIGGAMAITDVKKNMESGSSMSTAVFKSGVQNILFQTNPVLMTALTLAPMGIQGYNAATQFRRRRAEELNVRNRGGMGVVGNGFVDTQQAYTMRQAAVQQIQGNKLNARNALGGEARIFGSQYRR